MPCVSVVIPAFNRIRYLPETVESVLAQTFTDREVIVVDDGSTDGTADSMVSRFGSAIRVERFPHNQGRSMARNAGWAMAHGEFVAFLDSDDLWLPEKLARQIPLFEAASVSMVHCWAGKTDENGHALEAKSAEMRGWFETAFERGYSYAGITQTWCRMYTSAVVLRRELLRSTGGFDPRLSNFEDWDLLWKVARAGTVATVREQLLLHRAHAGNTPTVWTDAAVPWLAMNRKHLAELANPDGAPDAAARRNLLINMALGEYWRRDLPASRRWMRQALAADPLGVAKPNYVWGAPLLHACLPPFAARWLTRRAHFDDYATPEGERVD